MSRKEEFMDEMLNVSLSIYTCLHCSVRYCKDRGNERMRRLPMGACSVVAILWEWWQAEHPEQDTPYEQDDGIIRRIQVEEGE